MRLIKSSSVRRALVVGLDEASVKIIEAELNRSKDSYQIVGFVDDSFKKQDLPPEPEGSKLKVLGDLHSLPTLIRKYRIDTLILTNTFIPDDVARRFFSDIVEKGLEVLSFGTFYERLTDRVLVSDFTDHWHLEIPLTHPLLSPGKQALKRIFDIFGATIGLMLLSLAFPFIALAIYIDSPGPIFYVQHRVGKAGKVFRAYKFRTMVPDAEKDRPIWAKENDPRVTRVGRILRKTHIDELPQFINVLKGEMSLVGPRPERPEFVEELAREISFYRIRHAIKPGMAGWAFVKHGYASSKEDSKIKLEYDLYYIKHWSLWLDIVILFKTFFRMLSLKGRA